MVENIRLQGNKYCFKDVTQCGSNDHSPTILMVEKTRGMNHMLWRYN